MKEELYHIALDDYEHGVVTVSYTHLAHHGICIPDAGSKIFQRAHGAGLETRRVGQHLSLIHISFSAPGSAGMRGSS